MRQAHALAPRERRATYGYNLRMSVLSIGDSATLNPLEKPSSVQAAGTGADPECIEQHGAEAATENADDRIADGSQAEFLEETAGDVAADSAADELDEESNRVHDTSCAKCRRAGSSRQRRARSIRIEPQADLDFGQQRRGIEERRVVP